MFPDAVTLRGKRHMEELAALTRQGTPCGIIFLVHWPHADFFLPDYHTDLDFSDAFRKIKDVLFIKAVSLKWNSDLSLSTDVREISIPWNTIDREARDRGSYIIMLHIAEDLNLTAGSLGALCFPKGYYLYVGSAKGALTKRLTQHLRQHKTLNGHIDYLREQADRCIALPIRSSESLEHRLAEALRGIADWSVPYLGSSDCECVSHLFGFQENPLHTPLFIDLLQYFRIDRLEEEIERPL
jgi:sugar fermentation stimulation protein A